MRPSKRGQTISSPDGGTRIDDPERDRVLTLNEAADYLRLTPGALYAQRYRSENPGALGIRVGRKIIYRMTDIDNYLDRLLAESQSGVVR